MGIRFGGQLKNWNAERGFGFIVADDGGAELFVHISAFQRRDLAPLPGEPLTFEVEPDREGRKRAVRVLRANESAGSATRQLASQRETRRRRHDEAESHSMGGSILSAVITLCIAGAIGWFGYTQYMQRASRQGAVSDAAPPAQSAQPLQEPAPLDSRCDGRKYCSQMTSCREAKWFLKNCPGTEMDGDGDGVPCEQQWCGG